MNKFTGIVDWWFLFECFFVVFNLMVNILMSNLILTDLFILIVAPENYDCLSHNFFFGKTKTLIGLLIFQFSRIYDKKCELWMDRCLRTGFSHFLDDLVDSLDIIRKFTRGFMYRFQSIEYFQLIRAHVEANQSNWLIYG